MANENNNIMMLLGEISSDLKSIRRDLDKHSASSEKIITRLSKVEGFQMKIIGMAMAASAAGSAFSIWLKGGGT